MYRKHKEEIRAATQRYQGSAARCTVLSARCAAQQRVLGECQEWQQESEELHALLEQNSHALSTLSVEAGIVIAALPADADAELEGEAQEGEELEGEHGAQLAELRQALLGREAELEAARELLQQRTAELQASRAAPGQAEAAAAPQPQAEGGAEVEVEEVVAAVVSELLGRVVERAADDADDDAADEAEDEGQQQLQVTRLKDEVQRMTTRARELGEFLEVEAEAAQLTQEELGKMGQQAAHLHTPARAPARTLHAHRHAHLCV